MTLTTRLKNALAAGLVGLVSLLPLGCSAERSFEMPKSPFGLNRGTYNEARDKSKPRLEGEFSTNIGTNFITEAGFIIGKGPVHQNSLSLNRTNNFVDNDSFSGGVWTNYDFGDEELVETDFWIKYQKPVEFMKKCMEYAKPEYGDKVSIGFQHRNYPGELLGGIENHDNILTASWTHNSRADLEFTLYHLFEDRDAKTGDFLAFNVSKKLPLGKFMERDFYLTPKFNTGWTLNHYYGLSHVVPHLIPGITISSEKDNISFSGTVKYQIAALPEIKDIFYSGLELSFRF